jgi:predicted RND superfamily exporter protein
MEFNLASYVFLGSIPIIVALVQVFKVWILDSRFYPMLSIVFGLIFNIGIAWRLGIDLTSAIVMGIIAGMSAAGLYSGLQKPEAPKPGAQK